MDSYLCLSALKVNHIIWHLLCPSWLSVSWCVRTSISSLQNFLGFHYFELISICLCWFYGCTAMFSFGSSLFFPVLHAMGKEGLTTANVTGMLKGKNSLRAISRRIQYKTWFFPIEALFQMLWHSGVLASTGCYIRDMKSSLSGASSAHCLHGSWE